MSLSTQWVVHTRRAKQTESYDDCMILVGGGGGDVAGVSWCGNDVAPTLVRAAGAASARCLAVVLCMNTSALLNKVQWQQCE